VFASAHIGSKNPFRDSQLRRLLIRPGAIGDCIVSLPALEFLKADYTEVWVAAQNVPLIRFADRVRSIESTGLNLVGFQDMPVLKQLEEFDSIVSWYGTNRPEFREQVKHLPFAFQRALPSDSRVHAVDFYMRQVGGPDGSIPHIECPRRDDQFLAIHPFSGNPDKNWPLEKYEDLAERFALPVEFSAGPEEPLEHAYRTENLYEVACWLASARMYLGNDSGITHLAAAVHTPTLAIFRATDPGVWGPRGEIVSILRGDPHVEDVIAMLDSLA
jgi:heptosyltransferase-3